VWTFFKFIKKPKKEIENYLNNDLTSISQQITDYFYAEITSFNGLLRTMSYYYYIESLGL
jgi:hypothetical protein